MADTAANSSPSETQQQQANWKAAKNYYYWHGHEKDRAREGDVAPLPTPVLVAKDEAAAPVAVPPQPVKKYSWADGKNVSIYVETVEQPGEEVDPTSVAVNWKTRSLHLTFAVSTAAGATKQRQLVLHLHKDILPDSCTHKVKESTKQIYLRAVKAEEGAWFELTGKEVKDVDSDNES